MLVNNTGILRAAPIAQTTLDDYMSVIRVNQAGTSLGIRAVIPAMAEAGGSIINVSSIYGQTCVAGVVAYAASKFAVRGMTKVAATELTALGIRVNSLHPGVIDTPRLSDAGVPDETIALVVSTVPRGRLGDADEIASLALLLASDDSSFSRGSKFVVDGGGHLRHPDGLMGDAVD